MKYAKPSVYNISKIKSRKQITTLVKATGDATEVFTIFQR